MSVTLHSKVWLKIKTIRIIRFMFVRFLAAEYGLVGNTNLERAQANEVVDAVSDLQNAMI